MDRSVKNRNIIKRFFKDFTYGAVKHNKIIDPKRDKTHADHIESWAHFVKTNPNWKKIHTEFINAQFEKANSFIKRLLKQPNGKEKIIKLYKIKNKKGYSKLLG